MDGAQMAIFSTRMLPLQVNPILTVKQHYFAREAAIAGAVSSNVPAFIAEALCRAGATCAGAGSTLTLLPASLYVAVPLAAAFRP